MIAIVAVAVEDYQRGSLLRMRPSNYYHGLPSVGRLTLTTNTSPEAQIRSRLDEQFMRHLTFGSQHCRVYVGHELVQAQIDAYVASASATTSASGPPRTPLVVVGGSGTGKSAALANWLTRATAVPGFVLPHFCGSTANSTLPEAIVQVLASSRSPWMNVFSDGYSTVST